jgi:hypothetical protein
MSEEDHAALLNARHDLLSSITKLLERAYNLGYSDGKEDAEIKHKNHVMKILKQEKH